MRLRGQCFTILVTAFAHHLGDSLVVYNYSAALLACSVCWSLSRYMQLKYQTGLKLNPLSDFPCCFSFLGSWFPSISREYKWTVVTSMVAVELI